MCFIRRRRKLSMVTVKFRDKYVTRQLMEWSHGVESWSGVLEWSHRVAFLSGILEWNEARYIKVSVYTRHYKLR